MTVKGQGRDTDTFEA